MKRGGRPSCGDGLERVAVVAEERPLRVVVRQAGAVAFAAAVFERAGAEIDLLHRVIYQPQAGAIPLGGDLGLR